MKTENKIVATFRTDTWVKPYLKKYKKLFFLSLLLGFLTFFCGGALMFTSGFLISSAAALPENIMLIYTPIVLTRAFGIGRPLFRYAERLTSHNWVLKMTSDLRLRLYRSAEKEAIFFKEKFQTGDILGLLSEDINHLQNLFLRTIFPNLIALLLTFFIAVATSILSPLLALWLLFLLFLLVIVLPVWSLTINGARQEKQKSARNDLYNHLTDNILGVSDWIFSQQGDRFIAFHEAAEKQLRAADKKIKAFHRKRDLVLQIIFAVGVISLLIWSSLYFKGTRGGGANWIAAFALCVFPLIDAFALLPDAAEELNVYQDSVKRLNALDDHETPTKHAAEVPALKDTTITMTDLSFTYPDAYKQTLDQLSITFAPGEKIALLGKSGAGKTTLTRLIRGDLSPSKGSVLVGGVPANEFGDDITRYIGVLQQTPYLFHTTILNNVRIGNEAATEEEVWRALAEAGLSEMVNCLPKQLETMVDEAGLRFSGGQRHRLALARLLVSHQPIVLLDEPAVGLDPITEQQLLETIFHVLADRTIIWVTHHLQGVNLADRVLFIEDGQLVIDGSPQTLLTTNTRYQKLYELDQGR